MKPERISQWHYPLFGIGWIFAMIFLWNLTMSHSATAQTISVVRNNAVASYWEWSAFWGIDGLDFPLATYKSGKTIRAMVFYSEEVGPDDPYWGFCSEEIGVCHVYLAWADNSVYQSIGTRIRKGETAETAFIRFQRQQFLSDETAKELARLGSSRGRLLFDISEEEKKRLDSLNPNVVASKVGNRIQTNITTIRLPVLSLPAAALNKIKNQFVEDLIRGQGKGPCKVIVPFADKHAPLVPVLTICPGQRGIQFWRKVDDSWIATAGGWMQQQDILRRFEPRIRKYASLTVVP